MKAGADLEQGADRPAVYDDPAARGPKNAGDEAEQGALAGAIRADDPEDLALANGNIHISKRPHVASPNSTLDAPDRVLLERGESLVMMPITKGHVVDPHGLGEGGRLEDRQWRLIRVPQGLHRLRACREVIGGGGEPEPAQGKDSHCGDCPGDERHRLRRKAGVYRRPERFDQVIRGIQVHEPAHRVG